MKRIKGNSNYIVRHLMHEVIAEKKMNEEGRLVPKISRHEQKQKVRDQLQSEGRTCSQSELAKMMPVYANRTQFHYAKCWKHFFDYVNNTYQVKDVEKITLKHMKTYLGSLINSDMKYSSFKVCCAQLAKLEVAMNKVRSKPLYYSEQIKEFKGYAKLMLNNEQLPTRAYLNPEKIISQLEGKAKVAAELQYYGGARVSEILELKIERNFLGVQGEYGVFKLTNTKGGRIREMRVPVDLYNRTLEFAKTEGKFSIDQGFYTRTLKKAALSVFERFTGTHGLRWNFAQNRYYEYQSKHNMTSEEAMLRVSFDLGHSRAEITGHYLS